MFVLKKFRFYLITDYHLHWHFLAKKDAKAWIIRWILLLQEFNFQIRDKKGSDNLVVDHLSNLSNTPSFKILAIDYCLDEQLLAIWQSRGSPTSWTFLWQERHLTIGQNRISIDFFSKWNTFIGMILIFSSIVMIKSIGDVIPMKRLRVSFCAVMIKPVVDTMWRAYTIIILYHDLLIF